MIKYNSGSWNTNQAGRMLPHFVWVCVIIIFNWFPKIMTGFFSSPNSQYLRFHSLQWKLWVSVRSKYKRDSAHPPLDDLYVEFLPLFTLPRLVLLTNLLLFAVTSWDKQKKPTYSMVDLINPSSCPWHLLTWKLSHKKAARENLCGLVEWSSSPCICTLHSESPHCLWLVPD